MKIWLSRLSALALFSPLMASITAGDANASDQVDGFWYANDSIVVKADTKSKRITLEWGYDRTFSYCDGCRIQIFSYITDKNSHVSTSEVQYAYRADISYDYIIPLTTLKTAKSIQFGIRKEFPSKLGPISKGRTITIDNQIKEKLKNSRVTFVHTDILGTPVAETDNSGNLIQ